MPGPASRKRRADLLVVEQDLAPSAARAQALILAGVVMRGPDRPVDKPGELLDATTELYLRGEPMPFVSRGGVKLAAALDRFAVDPRDLVCLDVGASTGGFTDCLLQRGARRVYAVDVGYGQMAWRVRQDARVVVIERANIRTLARDAIEDEVRLVVIDVSFISLRRVLPAVLPFLCAEARLVALVKPQFEVDREHIGVGGIVRDDAARLRALCDVETCAAEHGFVEVQTMDSPIKGAKGNHEYLLTARRRG